MLGMREKSCCFQCFEFRTPWCLRARCTVQGAARRRTRRAAILYLTLLRLIPPNTSSTELRPPVSYAEQEYQYPQYGEICRHEASSEEDLLNQFPRCGILPISEAALEGADCIFLVGVDGPAEDLADELRREEGIHIIGRRGLNREMLQQTSS